MAPENGTQKTSVKAVCVLRQAFGSGAFSSPATTCKNKWTNTSANIENTSSCGNNVAPSYERKTPETIVSDEDAFTYFEGIIYEPKTDGVATQAKRSACLCCDAHHKNAFWTGLGLLSLLITGKPICSPPSSVWKIGPDVRENTPSECIRCNASGGDWGRSDPNGVPAPLPLKLKPLKPWLPKLWPLSSAAFAVMVASSTSFAVRGS